MGRLHYLSLLCLLFVTTSWAGQEQGCTRHPWPYTNNTLLPGQVLRPGDWLASGKAALVFDANTSDVYLMKTPGMERLWSTGTGGTNASQLYFDSGNLILAASDGYIWWQSKTSNASILVVEDNCRMSLYAKAPYEDKVWSSNVPMCITTHINMHSHDDVGWLLTPERYADGCHAPGGGTDGIMTQMMSALADNPERKFSEVEMYFFERWWAQQNESMKDLTRLVVARGQLQFINAGWSMHDEACVHQESAISNMEVGAQFLRREFGNTMNLTIGWHIDPFGHASTTPRIMAQMGFDAFFFWRTDYQQRDFMMKTKTVESVWNPSPSLGPSVQMFTSIMFDSYCMGCNNAKGWYMCPSPFYSMSCEAPTPWEEFFQPPQSQEEMEKRGKNAKIRFHGGRFEKVHQPHFKAQEGYTIQQMAADYVTYIREYAEYFRSGHVLIPWGCDFQHENAHISFQLMDQILAEVNGNASYGMKMQYSHPTDYINAIKEMNYQWPRNDYDYFLDSDNGHAYWSGYFSSRAEYKGYERFLMNQRFGIEMALSSVNLTDSTTLSGDVEKVEEFRKMLGVAQHHDSITGTERINVRERYQFLLSRAASGADQAFSDAIQSATGVAVTNCPLLNLSICPAVDPLQTGTTVSVYLYNPLARERTEYITIPVPLDTITIVAIGANGTQTTLACEVAPTWELTLTPDLTSPSPHFSHPYQVTFAAKLSPLGLHEFHIVPQSTPGSTFIVSPTPVTQGVDFTIQNDHYNLIFDGSTKFPKRLDNLASNSEMNFTENVMTYCPHPNYCEHPSDCRSTQASGAYIFRTCHNNEQPVPYTTTAHQVVKLSGPFCQEIRQFISNSSNIHQAWRLCRGMNYVELVSGIGEIEMGPSGTEVILKLKSDVDSAQTWYTDSEALEMQMRVRDARPNYPYNATELVAANFFPCNAFSFINSTTSKHHNLGVLGDRSRAAASLHDGELEFLVQRRLRYDDSRGVNQNLNESTRVLTVNRIIANSAQLTADVRLNSLSMTHQPLIRFGPAATNNAPYPAFAYPLALPPSIHLHTRSILEPGKIILRLQHLFGRNEDGVSAEMEASQLVNLVALLPSGVVVDSIEEYDINGITRLADIHRLDFLTCNPETETSTPIPPIAPSLVPGTVTAWLHPMDIRTFIVKYHW